MQDIYLEKDGIGQVLNTYESIYIFGCGLRGKEAAYHLNKANIKVSAFYDNDWTLWGKRVVYNWYCEKPHNADVSAVCIIAVSKKYQYEIKNQVSELGFKNVLLWKSSFDEEIAVQEEYFDRYISLLNKRTPKSKLYFVMDITEHCNLNCQMCDHFSPLSDKYFVEIQSVEKDIKRIAELFGNDVPFVCLEGGEPLLHPEICRIISIVDKYLPNTEIQIFTNGIKLLSMTEEFWRVCRDSSVVLMITKYPMGFDYSKVESIAKLKSVELRYFNNKEEIKSSIHKPIDLTGKQDCYSNFHSCYMANAECVDLKNGRLYPCTFAANIHIFNKYYGKNITVCDKDYLDIHSEITADDVRYFLCNPIPACKYCMVDKWSYGHKWEVSKKHIEEWT